MVFVSHLCAVTGHIPHVDHLAADPARLWEETRIIMRLVTSNQIPEARDNMGDVAHRHDWIITVATRKIQTQIPSKQCHFCRTGETSGNIGL